MICILRNGTIKHIIEKTKIIFNRFNYYKPFVVYIYVHQHPYLGGIDKYTNSKKLFSKF